MLDALSQASHNVAVLLNLRLDIPPIKRDDIRTQAGDTYVGDSEEQAAADSTPVSIVEVHEVWEVILDVDEFELQQAFVVISAKYKSYGYEGGDWSDVTYEGFYTTLEEAENEIGGYLS